MDEVELSAEHSISVDEEYKEEKACDAYDIILSLRDKEVDQYSIKANLFIVTQSAIVAFSGKLLADSIPSNTVSDLFTVSLFCSLGFILSFICNKLLEGASFWIDYYQTRLGTLEPAKLKNISIFSNHPGSNNPEPASRLLESQVAKRNRRKFKYYSTRKSTIGISYLFSVLWGIILLISIITFGLNNYEYYSHC